MENMFTNYFIIGKKSKIEIIKARYIMNWWLNFVIKKLEWDESIYLIFEINLISLEKMSNPEN